MPEGQIPFPMSDVMINYRHKKALASFKKDVRQALELFILKKDTNQPRNFLIQMNLFL
jgi:hypothetical protein